MPGPTPSTGTEKVAALGTWAMTNGAVAAAPLLPGNDSGLGGFVVNVIAGFINGVIQALKMHGWYKQNEWAMWTALVLAFAVCLLIWHDDLRKAALNGMGAATNAMNNYAPLNKLGVLPPGTDSA